ncbi:hypothetical protein [Candidatus Venteria ishoeyi]|nr:hypothetical protein [Candidatus Venteria ishoeyi]
MIHISDSKIIRSDLSDHFMVMAHARIMPSAVPVLGMPDKASPEH